MHQLVKKTLIIIKRHRTYVLENKFLSFVFSTANNSLEVYRYKIGYAVAQLVEALRYKSEGCGFDSR